jgi:hypothetical protein
MCICSRSILDETDSNNATTKPKKNTNNNKNNGNSNVSKHINSATASKSDDPMKDDIGSDDDGDSGIIFFVRAVV